MEIDGKVRGVHLTASHLDHPQYPHQGWVRVEIEPRFVSAALGWTFRIIKGVFPHFNIMNPTWIPESGMYVWGGTEPGDVFYIGDPDGESHRYRRVGIRALTEEFELART